MKRFAGKIRGKPVLVLTNDRQATTIHGNAVRDTKRFGQTWGANGEMTACTAELKRLDRPDMLDDSCEQDLSRVF